MGGEVLSENASELVISMTESFHILYWLIKRGASIYSIVFLPMEVQFVSCVCFGYLKRTVIGRY